MYTLFSAVSIFLSVIEYAILLYVIMSWFRPRNRFYLWLMNFVTPFIKPFYPLAIKIMTRSGVRVDFSAWMAIVALRVVRSVLQVVYDMLPAILR